jgi:hypothetical protein
MGYQGTSLIGLNLGTENTLFLHFLLPHFTANALFFQIPSPFYAIVSNSI